MKKIKFPEYQDHKDRIPFYIDLRFVHNSSLHHHEYAEMSVIVGGRGVEFINEVGQPLQEGSVSFLLPHQMHIVYSDRNDPLRKYSCMFDMAYLLDAYTEPEVARWLYSVGVSIPSFASLGDHEQSRMNANMELLLEEYAAPPTPFRDHLLRLRLLEALLLFVKASRQSMPATAIDAITGTNMEQHAVFWEIIRHVHLHYTEPLTLKELSTKFHFSAEHISRSFKSYTGSRFLDYVCQLRVNRAVSMLLHTNMPISDIACSVGFNSFRTFRRVFQRMTGQTASELRETGNWTQTPHELYPIK